MHGQNHIKSEELFVGIRHVKFSLLLCFQTDCGA